LRKDPPYLTMQTIHKSTWRGRSGKQMPIVGRTYI
jgi:hypothetical protein